MINRLFRTRFFPLVFQLLSLAAFILLIADGLAADTSDMAFAKVLRNTNAANLIVWSYWWPLVVLSAIFLGRVWCLVCPVELVTSLASKAGLKRKAPAFLRSGWVMAGFYMLILFIGIHTLSIHRIPYRMAIYMLLLFLVAVVSGLLFSRNTFCAHLCPVGHMLGLYARLAPFGWGVRDPSVCWSCEDKSCISEINAYDFQARSCGVGLRPVKIDDNSDCLLCGQCLKACDRHNPGLARTSHQVPAAAGAAPHPAAFSRLGVLDGLSSTTPRSSGRKHHRVRHLPALATKPGENCGPAGRPNPGWFRRRWFKDLLELKAMTAAQAFFCMVVSGFVIYEIFVEWPLTKGLLMFLPLKLEQLIGVQGIWGHGIVKSMSLFIGLPVIIWMLPFLGFRLTGARLSLRDYSLKFGIAFIPIMAAAHSIKAILKTTSRIPYWEYVAKDPVGVETASALLDKTLVLAPLPFWREPLVTLLGFGLMVGGIALSFVVVRKLIGVHTPEAGWRSMPLYLIPILYGGIFTTMLVAWRIF